MDAAVSGTGAGSLICITEQKGPGEAVQVWNSPVHALPAHRCVCGRGHAALLV